MSHLSMWLLLDLSWKFYLRNQYCQDVRINMLSKMILHESFYVHILQKLISKFNYYWKQSLHYLMHYFKFWSNKKKVMWTHILQSWLQPYILYSYSHLLLALVSLLPWKHFWNHGKSIIYKNFNFKIL